MKTNDKFRFSGKAALALAILALCAALYISVPNAVVTTYGASHILPENKAGGADCILVLGAKVLGGQPSSMLKDRLDVAYELYESKAAPKILVSGAYEANGYNEVDVMRGYLQQKGVPDTNILLDYAGSNTYDSMYRAAYVFQWKNVLVVTQEYHQYRALYIGGSLGMNVQGVACDRYRSPKLPYFVAREIAARVKDFINIELVKPIPSYMGQGKPDVGSPNQETVG